MSIKKNSRPNPRPMTDQQKFTAASDMVRRHVSQLSEHFDSVTILCTRLEPNGSTSAHINGSGDIKARRAMAEDFLDAINLAS